MVFTIIAVVCNGYGFGFTNKIPWNIPEDKKFFKETTKDNVVLMGSNTYRSLPGGPLKDRINIVLTSHPDELGIKSIDISMCVAIADTKNITDTVDTKDVADTVYDTNLVYTSNSLTDIVIWLQKNHKNKKWFAIGGVKLFDLLHERNMIRRLIITKIDADYFTDITFDYTKYGLPLIQDCLADHIADNATVYYYDVDNKEENEVANTMVELCNIRTTPDRTGAGRKCTTSKSFTFDMRKGSFPLFTHRPMFLRGIFEELMLNLRGQSDSKILEAKGINVWQDNTSREFLDKCGLEHLPIGDIGPSYGFNMRHFGAKYVDCKTDYHGQGFDQLSYCLNELKCNPYSTRALIQLYDPTTVKHTPLPPCLYGYQFNYDGEFLNLTLIQRSSDVLLAGGWNVATGALLLLMFCQELKMKPGVLGWQVSNMHLYAEPENLEAIENMDWTQVKTFPHLFLREPSSGTGAKDLRITQYEFDDLTLVGYAPGKKISLKMAV